MTELLITALSIFLTTLATWAVTKFCNWLDAKTDGIKNIKYQKMLKDAQDELESATIKAIIEVNETYVKALKEDGNFSEEDARLANMKALDIVKKIMSEASLTILANASIDIDAAIKNEIEVQLPAIKIGVTTNEK